MEIERLKMFSLVAHVVGARPNRHDLMDLLYARLQDSICGILDVQFLGRGFYHIKLEHA
jgi:hypothetical protein